MDNSELSTEIAYLTQKILAFLNDNEISGLPEGRIEEIVDTSPFTFSPEQRQQIIRQLEFQHSVTQNSGAAITKDHRPWLAKRSPELEFYYWNRLKRFYIETGSLPAGVVSVLDRDSDEILDYCGDPSQDSSWKRRGMVMGHVQSGKTTNYSALICKAADAGYRIIILLAGLTNSLRSQTQERLDETFIGKKSLFNAAVEEKMTVVQFGEGESHRFPAYGTSRDRDFKKENSDYGVSLSALKEPIIFVLKKNKSVLENLKVWVETQRIQERKTNIHDPLLLIDDEADNASINTKKEPDEVTAINGLIREILSQFSRSTYVGYTATPFANIFINPDSENEMKGDDLFPANFIKALDPPSNYVGSSRVFSEEGDLKDHMVREINDYEKLLPLSHKSSHQVDRLPGSLGEAIRCFLLVRTIRFLRGDGTSHSTMMINVSRFNAVQANFLDLVYEHLEQLKNSIRMTAKLPPADQTDAAFQAIRATHSREFSDIEFSFDELSSVMFEAVSSIEVRTVNMLGGALDYSAKKESGLHVIAIGGLALSRGLTLEGLCVSYILRNTAASDTLMQMARWFGYRPGYEGLCRLWIPKISLEHYQYIDSAIEELRDEVKRMKTRRETPEQFGLKVRRSETGIGITAANKMRSSERRVIATDLSNKHVEGFALFYNKIINDRHLLAVNEFIAELGPRNEEQKPSARITSHLKQHLVWTEVNSEIVGSLARKFSFPGTQTVLGRIDGKKSLFIDYFDSCLAREYESWDVVVPSLKSGREHAISGFSIKLRERAHGKIETDTDSSVFRPYGRRNRVADPLDAAMLLSEGELDEVSRLREEQGIKGDSATTRYVGGRC